jgi:hypothetical protein
MDSNMENDYREKWCQFLTGALSSERAFDLALRAADKAIMELKERDGKKFFDQPEKGYR